MIIPLPSALDARTLSIAIAFVFLANAVFAQLLWAFRRRFEGAGHWIAGQWLLALGALAVAAQAMGLPYEVLSISNASLLAAMAAMGHAVWSFGLLGRFPRWLYAAGPATLATWFICRGIGIPALVASISALMAVLAGYLALALRTRARDGFTRLLGFGQAYFACIALVGALRAVPALFGYAPLTIAKSGSMGGAYYLAAVVVAFVNLFAYFLLSSAAVERSLQERERELRRRNQELVETLETKDALIAVIGHDLRAPVWSASRYARAHLVEFEGDLNTKRESMETLAAGLDRISGLLDSLLEWALCASGRVKTRLERVCLDEVMSEVEADLASTAESKGVALELGRSGVEVSADRRFLATVLRNLVSNAIKYSKAGSAVRVVVSGGDSEVTVAVEDRGVGMKSEQLERLFVPGKTMLTLGTGGEQGKGFGLAVSKQFMEAMGGDIRVQSRLGEGTRFEILLPTRPEPA